MSGSGYALAVLFAINLMNFFDRQIIGGVGEGIRREWALSDTALGLLGTVFTLLYAVVGLPLGRLSDRIERRKILAGGVFVWSLLTARLGHGAQLRAADRRAARRRRRRGDLLAGVDVAHRRSRSRPTQRARAIAIWMLGLPLGLGLANGAGGWILQNWGWRNAFYIAAVPGILCAVAALAMREPRARHASKQHAVGARRRPGNPVPAGAVDSDDAVGHRVGGAAQLQHVRARRVRRAVPRPLPPHELLRRRLGRRRASTASPASSG